MMRFVGMSLAALLASVQVAHADPAEDLGLMGDDYGVLAGVILMEVMPGVATCGPAMTDEACDAVRAHIVDDLKASPDRLRDVQLQAIEQRFGSLDAALEDWRSQPQEIQEADLCKVEEMTWRCQTFIDAMFYGGLVPYLQAARLAASREVTQFYTDGRPFED
ncbi:hypothetical protein [Celeribacter ethanolicus]|uniref:hypothetical protein n=1 Tax=Celeribacter ethanolicus TaxID=1758178 RepID=UPI000834344D|nr:hypothetical protein [Celeribacter ethanolicus]